MFSKQSLHHPAFHTSNIEEFLHTVETRFGGKKTDVTVSAAFEAHGNALILPDVALLSAASNSALTVDYPGFDFVRLSIPLKGSGSTRIGNATIGIDAQQSCITSFDCPSTVSCAAEHEWINLRIGRSATERCLTSLLGAKPSGSLDFDATASFRNPRLNDLRELAGFLTSRWDSVADAYPTIMLRELEQVILIAFLLGTNHQFSAILERKPADGSVSQLERIEGYIEANWNRPISIETLVEISELSARAIFRLFQRIRGYSPMAFAKMVRLRRAKEMLVAADESATVSAIAFKCGFANHGHFARDYNNAFGELPSVTLLRSKSTIS